MVGSLLIGAKLISSVDGAALVASADLIDTGVEPLDLVGAVGVPEQPTIRELSYVGTQMGSSGCP